MKAVESSPRKQAAARKAASATYPYRCCVVCGLQIEASLELAHLDHNAGNNDPDNLAYMCGTHHWMYDCGLYPIAAIKMLRAHWQDTKGVPNHKPRMKDAGVKVARTRDYRRRGHKAAASRAQRLRTAASRAVVDRFPSSKGSDTSITSRRSAPARKAWTTRRAKPSASPRDTDMPT
jgi:hypothetical protein